MKAAVQCTNKFDFVKEFVTVVLADKELEWLLVYMW